ncbi:16543_t:CDS:2 [Funneliformis geosporum]|uniref:16543_t:CDS:1 n=1 Tax=Funneliformis geosporum TaxID=1117311 RepID=A0A9W4T948_9GLOM|nr:16543_t:CDS:2 [Funneliformis geosporum]
MNEENNQIIRITFAETIEWLEKFIEKSNYFSDWLTRKQKHDNSITRSDIGSMNAIKVKKNFVYFLNGLRVMVDSCPPELIPLLYHFHAVLEGQGKELKNQAEQKADRVMEQYQKIEETKNQEFNPAGNAEQGRETFERIVATISNYDLFPEDEIAPDNSPEGQAAVKELERLLEQK